MQNAPLPYSSFTCVGWLHQAMLTFLCGYSNSCCSLQPFCSCHSIDPLFLSSIGSDLYNASVTAASISKETSPAIACCCCYKGTLIALVNVVASFSSPLFFHVASQPLLMMLLLLKITCCCWLSMINCFFTKFLSLWGFN